MGKEDMVYITAFAGTENKYKLRTIGALWKLENLQK